MRTGNSNTPDSVLARKIIDLISDVPFIRDMEELQPLLELAVTLETRLRLKEAEAWEIEHAPQEPPGDRRTPAKAMRCSFCGKPQNEVKKLIAGPSVRICNECIDICNEIIADDRQLKD